MNSSQTRRVIAAGMVGNVLEWYDFAIYGYFAAQKGRQFVPHEDAVAQLLSTFGVFAVGYLARPLGGVFMGHIGDCLGRRAALTFSVAAIAISTFLIGLLPGYRTISFAEILPACCLNNTARNKRYSFCSELTNHGCRPVF